MAATIIAGLRRHKPRGEGEHHVMHTQVCAVHAATRRGCLRTAVRANRACGCSLYVLLSTICRPPFRGGLRVLWVLTSHLGVCYVCMHACMCVCKYACMYVCMYVYMHVCMHVCMNVCGLCMHACMHACMYECMYACMNVCVLCMHAYMHECMYVCMHA